MARPQSWWISGSALAHLGFLGVLLVVCPEITPPSSLTLRLTDAPEAGRPAHPVAVPVPIEKARASRLPMHQPAPVPRQEGPVPPEPSAPARLVPELPADRTVPDTSPIPNGQLLSAPSLPAADDREPSNADSAGAGSDGGGPGHGARHDSVLPITSGNPTGTYLASDVPVGGGGAARRGSGMGSGDGGSGAGSVGTGPGDGRAAGTGLVAGRPSIGNGAGAADSFRAIRSQIEKAKTYPDTARRTGVEGTVEVRFRITSTGQVAAVEITQSSGHAVLDESAVQTVRRAAPYPVLPGWIRVPLAYRLRQ